MAAQAGISIMERSGSRISRYSPLWIAILCLLLHCTGCRQGASSGKSEGAGRVTVHLDSSRGGRYPLNPLGDLNATDSIPILHVFEGLVKRNFTTGFAEPCLAERWEEEALFLRRKDGKTESPEEAFQSGFFGRDGKVQYKGETRSIESLKGELGIEGWDVLPRTVYTFFLRRGVRWHDGRDFTAEDVRFSYEILKNEHSRCTRKRSFFVDLFSCEVIDSHTVRLAFRASPFNLLETLADLFILPKELFWREADSPALQGEGFLASKRHFHPVGTGPYAFHRWGGDFLDLKRNDGYWGRRPSLKEIRFHMIADGNTAFHLLQSENRLDFCFRLSPEQFQIAQKSDALRMHYFFKTYWIPNYDYIAWNLRREIFRDKRVRRAMAHLFNRQEFIDTVMAGCARTTVGHQARSCRFFDETVAAPPHDPDRAAVLLTEAGWIDRDGDSLLDKDGKPFSFTVLVPSKSPLCQKALRIFQEKLKRAGMEVHILSLDYVTMMSRIEGGNFDAFFLKWNLDMEPDPIGLWYSETGSQFRRTGFSNRDLDVLTQEIRTCLVPEKRKNLWHSFQEILAEEQPYLFLWEIPRFAAVQKRFSHVHFYPLFPGWNLCEWTLE